MSKRGAAGSGLVLAMFGTSVEDALPALLHVRDRVAAGFPQSPVRIAFTSKVIRRIWRERAAVPGYRVGHPQVPDDIFHVQGLESVMHSMGEEGIGSLVVQPVHIAPARAGCPDAGSAETVSGAGVSGEDGPCFPCRVAYGRPVLGGCAPAYPAAHDNVVAARSLSRDAELARQEKAALLYMGHGNKQCSTRQVYMEFAAEMRCQYPDIVTKMSLVEEGPSIDETVADLKKSGVTKIVLKPFMIAAGDHVRKDMVSDQPGSLKIRLQAAGFTVFPVCRGLGEDDAFADIFRQHAADAARDAGIELR